MAKKIPPQRKDWLDRLAMLNLHFGRFSSDIGGVLILAFALISLLALRGLTEGKFILFWVGLLREWFGWGSYLAVISLGMIGLLMLRRSEEPLPWGRIFALESAAFLALGLLTVIGGRSLENVEIGYGGGKLGWGLDKILSELITPLGSTLFFIFGTFFAAMTGFNLWQNLENWLLHIAGDGQEKIEEVPVEDEKEEKKTRKKPQVKLPPGFRKSLAMPKKEDERPATPRPRDERLPPLKLLLEGKKSRLDERTINQTAGLIEKTLDE